MTKELIYLLLMFNQHGGHNAPQILERNIMIHYINGFIISLRILAASLFGALGFFSGVGIIIQLGGFVGWFAGLWFIVGGIVVCALPYITGVRLYDEH